MNLLPLVNAAVPVLKEVITEHNSFLVACDFFPKFNLSWQICPFCLICLTVVPNLPNRMKIKMP